MSPEVLQIRGGYQTPYHKRRYAKERRAKLKKRQLCISAAAHGLATHGVLCERCRMTHRGRSA